MRKIYLFLPLFALLAVGCGGGSKGNMPWEDDLGGGNTPTPDPDSGTIEVGKALPAWSEGELDIHFINTGRGECCFYIMPDGTTMIVDAGEVKATHNPQDTSVDAAVEQKPNANVRPYMVDAMYIKHFSPNGRQSIDYCAPSHFHIDHIGSSGMATETAAAGYRKSGLLALYDELSKFLTVDYDEAGSIGKRYRRQDEIGTPFCITYDFESAEDGCVTVRDRDTMEQVRIPIAEVRAYIEERLVF